MDIFGIPTMIALPAGFLVLLAISLGTFRFFKAGAKRAVVSVVRVIVYGGFAFFVLIMGMLAHYYANGGH